MKDYSVTYPYIIDKRSIETFICEYELHFSILIFLAQDFNMRPRDKVF